MNKFPGQCVTCGKWVQAGHGHAKRVLGAWVIDCSTRKVDTGDDYDAIKDASLEDGSWYYRRRR